MVSPAPSSVLAVDMLERRLFDGERRSTVTIRDLAFDVGRTYGLVGPSGIGKTTALEMLSLAVSPEVVGRMTLRYANATVELGELLRDNNRRRLTALRGRLFGYVVQTSRLLPFLDVRENIRLAQSIAARRDDDYLNYLLNRLRIADLARAFPGDLSGGQRQRVSIARALAHRPAVVLADEPTSAVDQELAQLIMTTLVDYAQAHHAAVLVISHNTALLERFGIRLLAIRSRVAQGHMQTLISSSSQSGDFGEVEAVAREGSP